MEPKIIWSLPTICNSCFWLAKLIKVYPQKPQAFLLNWNNTGIMYRLSKEDPHFVLIQHQRWLPKHHDCRTKFNIEKMFLGWFFTKLCSLLLLLSPRWPTTTVGKYLAGVNQKILIYTFVSSSWKWSLVGQLSKLFVTLPLFVNFWSQIENHVSEQLQAPGRLLVPVHITLPVIYY